MVEFKSKDYHKATILQVVPSLIAGGVERGTIEIAKAIAAEEYKPLVLSSGGPLVSKILDLGGKHIKMNVDTKNPLLILYNIYRIARLAKEENIDIIHARSRAPAWSSYFAAKKAKCRFLTTFHGIYNFSESFKRQYNSIMTYGERVIAVSDFVRQHILDNYDIDESKIRVIHRGVDAKYFDPNNLNPENLEALRAKYHVPKSVPVILLPARMTRWKGHQSLIKALNIIRNKDFYCIIAGDLSKHPAFTAEIKSTLQELKLQSKIQIFGPESDMLSLYGISDIVLSTSIEPEAFGRVIIESQAMEKIVIATNIGGAAETIIDEVTGYHVSPNDPEELAEKIAFVLDNLNSSELDRIRKNARKSSSQSFSLETMQKKTMDVYRELL
jgi:glycosyltransferase involved in cell wall biosynthesis